MTTPTTQPTTPKASKPRVVRTPAQIAVDRLDATKARLERARIAAGRAIKAADKATAAANAANDEVKAAGAAVDFESKHPDLPVNRPNPGATT